MSDFFKKIKNINGIGFLAIGLIAGIILIIIGTNSGKSKADSNDTANNNSSDNDNEIEIDDEYIDKLEAQVASLVSSIDGVSNVKVMISAESGSEHVYAANGKTDESSGQYVITDNGAITLKIVSPIVRGVAVVCDGGNSAVIQEKIIGMLSALFDVPSNHIYVSG